MEVSLRKPQRRVFEMAGKHPGSFFRAYKKSSNQVRSYYRLMTKDFSPVKNFSAGLLRPFFEMDIIEKMDTGQYKIKDGVTLAIKQKKKK